MNKKLLTCCQADRYFKNLHYLRNILKTIEFKMGVLNGDRKRNCPLGTCSCYECSLENILMDRFEMKYLNKNDLRQH